MALLFFMKGVIKMREILFRGKRGTDDEWIYGYSVVHKDGCHAIIDSLYYDTYRVKTETVGQYIGLHDKHGKRIFEGDIVKTKFNRLCIVVWFSSPVVTGWDLEAVRTSNNLAYTYQPTPHDLWSSECLEVIGNIHDNPELLEEAK